MHKIVPEQIQADHNWEMKNMVVNIFYNTIIGPNTGQPYRHSGPVKCTFGMLLEQKKKIWC